MSNEPDSLLDLPYASRRLIVVVPDEVALAERQIANEAAEGGGARESRLKRALASVDTVKITGLGAEISLAAADARSDGLEVLSVGTSEAARLRLPLGHPRDRVLYVGHPAVPDIYYSAAHFHRLTFEHKFAEAVRLLMALGATNLSVEHVRGWSHDFAANLSVALPSQPVELGATAERQQSASRSALFRAELAGSDEPALPSDLVWLPHEPAWQQIAEGRTRYGLRDFALALTYEDDYGVNAGLKLGIAKYGLDLGGKFEDHQSTLWRISGTFQAEKAGRTAPLDDTEQRRSRRRLTRRHCSFAGASVSKDASPRPLGTTCERLGRRVRWLSHLRRGSARAASSARFQGAAARRVTLWLTQEGRTPWPTSRQQSSADATIGNSANVRRRRAPVIPRRRKRNKRVGATRRPRTET